MGALQTELAANISLQAGYYRRVFGNFIVTDNLLTSPADYDPFCITVPRMRVCRVAAAVRCAVSMT